MCLKAFVDGSKEFVNLPCLLAECLINTLKTCVECLIDALEAFLDLADSRQSMTFAVLVGGQVTTIWNFTHKLCKDFVGLITYQRLHDNC